MRITTLVENLEGAAGCIPAHGLSFSIKTKRHHLLMDTGPSELLLQNAQTLGIDLETVDTVILSHGHYDHADGIPAFSALNPGAVIYLRRGADGAYYSGSAEAGTLHYIGIDPAITAMTQLRWVDGEIQLDEELSLFGGITGRKYWPDSNRALSRRIGDAYVQDDFSHEQCLVVRENGKSVLLSGCAHNGILNILERYRALYGDVPDVVISGFHMKRDGALTRADEETVRATARELKAWPCVFYTCHCTGLSAFALMKEIMGEQLHYIHCGEVLEL